MSDQQRPLKEVKLPVTGYIAKVVTYFNRGETVAIAKAKWGSQDLSSGEDGEVKVNKFNPTFIFDEEDAMLEHGVKTIMINSEAAVTPSPEFLADLPDPDIKVLLKELRTAQNYDPESSKKKSTK